MINPCTSKLSNPASMICEIVNQRNNILYHLGMLNPDCDEVSEDDS